jgi:hypothetical protein
VRQRRAGRGVSQRGHRTSGRFAGLRSDGSDHGLCDHISGCHLNPAVSIGLWAGGRFPANQLLPYIVAQVVGAVVAGGTLFLIASGKAGFDPSAGFAANGYGTRRVDTPCCRL